MDVIITSDPEKLPSDIRALQDEAQPLPSGAQFFEQRFTFLGAAQNAVIGVVLALLGLVTFIFFIATLVYSFGQTTVASSSSDSQLTFGSLAVSVVFWFASYVMLSSLAPVVRLAWSGKHTRYGIFLVGDFLVSHSHFDTTIIPRDKFVSIANGKVGYLVGADTKSFTLPDIIDGRRPQLEAAIQSWKAASA